MKGVSRLVVKLCGLVTLVLVLDAQTALAKPAARTPAKGLYTHIGFPPG